MNCNSNCLQTNVYFILFLLLSCTVNLTEPLRLSSLRQPTPSWNSMHFGGILWEKTSCFIQPFSISLSVSFHSLCVEQKCVTYAVDRAHLWAPLCAVSPYSSWGSSTSSGYHWSFLSSLGRLQTPKTGLENISVFPSLLCRSELCDLLDLHLLMVLTGRGAPNAPRAAGSQDRVRPLVFSLPVPSHGSPQQYLWRAEANQLYPSPPPTKQVQRGSNSQLWYKSHERSLPYTLENNLETY